MRQWIIFVFLAGLVVAGVPGNLRPADQTAQADPTGAKADNKRLVAENPDLHAVGKLAYRNRIALNTAWVLVCSFLVFFMQAGFAMVETGLTRAKNVAHTMAMNVMVYSVGALGFWVCGFAFLSGNHGSVPTLGGAELLHKEFSLHLFGHDFGLFGYDGFFLHGHAFDAAMLTLFLFQMMFMDTAATIPTGAMAERWKFLSFLFFGFFMSMVIYPIYGNWVWGNGWLARLGANFHLGHGHVDFAGSTVVHMVGGVTALAGAYMLGPRIGKFKPNGSPNPMPAHSVPMYMVGTLILAFGWFGFNAGSTLAASDLNIGRIAVNTTLASAAGGIVAFSYMQILYGRPDPSFMCNGLLAGLVAITASCAFVAPWAAVLIGAVAGFLVIWSCLLVERVWFIDDPVGAISVHGTNGAWGALALGLFADGTYAPSENFNGVAGNVTGLFYGNGAQLFAQILGVAANILWVAPAAIGFFWVLDRLLGNRVSPQVELQGLDIPELGALGYITQDPKVPESRMVIQVAQEPRSANVPPNGHQRFTILVEGMDFESLTRIWSDLCQIGDAPPPAEFMAVYPFMTTVQGNRFRFRGGNPNSIRENLERLLQKRASGATVHARLEM